MQRFLLSLRSAAKESAVCGADTSDTPIKGRKPRGLIARRSGETSVFRLYLLPLS
jgi:hypothetical protein